MDRQHGKPLNYANDYGCWTNAYQTQLMGSPIVFQMAVVFHLGVSFLSPAPHIQAVAKFLMGRSPLYLLSSNLDLFYIITELLVSLFPIHSQCAARFNFQ